MRRRVEFLFHHTEMVTDELVHLRRAVYSPPGFERAIENTLVLQDRESARTSPWDHRLGRRIGAPTLLLWTDHDPTGGLDEAAICWRLAPGSRLTSSRTPGTGPSGRSRRNSTWRTSGS